MRRHGAAEQRGVSIAELKPFRETIRARLGTPLGEQVRKTLAEHWNAVLRGARGSYRQGAYINWQREAEDQIAALGSSVSADEIIETALAMYAMAETLPHRFVNDAAFRTQLVRRVRALSPGNVRLSAGANGRDHRTFRDIAPRTVSHIARWLVSAFGAAGVVLARLERQERDSANEIKGAVFRALDELQKGATAHD